MDKIDRKLLIISENGKFYGLITIGDIQRALLKKEDLNNCVINYVRDDILYSSSDASLDEIKNLMQIKRLEVMPIVDDGNLVDIINWEDIFPQKKINKPLSQKLPVVIMAGGKGERLQPLTNVLPKPLIPISCKTIIEDIMDRFVDISCDNFFISLNYMADFIEEYLNKKQNKNYHIRFFREEKPLGTAGSISLIKDELRTTFFLSNCDILLDINFQDLVNYHNSNNNIITVVSAVKNFSLPYGIIETTKDGQMISLNEKPQMLFQINSGLYVIEPKIFNYVKYEEFLHITDLLNRLLEAKEKIGVFPISERSWVDMGNWAEYAKIIHRGGFNA